MTIKEQWEANTSVPTLAEAFITQQIDMLKSLSKPFPAVWPFQKNIPWKLYPTSKVREMIWEAIEYMDGKELNMEFELYLNNLGKNWNNWDNENMREEFEIELVDSFIN